MRQKPKENISSLHKPVLLNEVLQAFGINAHLKGEKKIIDATLGLGGHTVEFVKRGFRVLGIDQDKEMLKMAEKRLKLACPTSKSDNSWGSFVLSHASFRKIDEVAMNAGFEKVDGVLFDLGVSSPQITSPSRGFSFRHNTAPLDMRMDSESGVKGSDLLNLLREDQLVLMFSVVLRHDLSKKLGSAVVKKRETKKFETVEDFKNLIEQIGLFKSGLNQATLPFLALRIAVNSELETLKEGLPKAFNLLASGGKLVVISFHSGEDAIVKNFFQETSVRQSGVILTKKPVKPGSPEIENNNRARSAKMRILQKI